MLAVAYLSDEDDVDRRDALQEAVEVGTRRSAAAVLILNVPVGSKGDAVGEELHAEKGVGEHEEEEQHGEVAYILERLSYFYQHHLETLPRSCKFKHSQQANPSESRNCTARRQSIDAG